MYCNENILMKKFWWNGKILLQDLLIEVFGKNCIEVEKKRLRSDYSVCVYESILNTNLFMKAIQSSVIWA